MKTALERFEEKYQPIPESGCWIWTSTIKNTGYGGFWFNGEPTSAHRVSWVLHVGEIPVGMVACHKCDTPLCVNPAHLFLGTSIDNVADKTTKGRQAKGERQGLAKLTDKDVIEIFLAKGSQQLIADRYGVHQSQVSNIKRGITWAHVTNGLFA